MRPLPCPAIAIGLVLAAAFGASPCVAEEKAPVTESFTFADKVGEYLDVLLNGKPVARYVYAFDKSTPARITETCKPFLHVFDAEGKGIITNGPSGNFPEKALYPHHRGIFIGWQKIGVDGKTVNLWEMKDGVQVHEKFLERRLGPNGATITSKVAWNLADGKPVLEEERTMALQPRPAPGMLVIDFTSKLKSAAGDLVLGGDPEHGGVQYRPANDLDKKETKYCLPKDAVDPRLDPAAEWHVMKYEEPGKTDKDGKPLATEIKKIEKADLPWAAMSYVYSGKRYVVEDFSHPANPKGTLWSAYRDYGRFGAFPKVDLKAGETLTLRYRFIVSQGDLPTRDALQKEYDAYAKAAAQ